MGRVKIIGDFLRGLLRDRAVLACLNLAPCQQLAVMERRTKRRSLRTFNLLFWICLPLSLAALGGANTAHGTVLSFRDGELAYSGTVDTVLRENMPDTAQGPALSIEWDTDDPPGTGLENITLIRFDEIFGTNGNQIPPGSQITSAVLTYTVFNVGNEGKLHEVLVDWDESTTYNGFGGNGTPGAQPGEYGELLLNMPSTIAVHTVNVTSSLERWSADPNSNRGWIVLPTGTDGVDVISSEHTDAMFRPLLVVRINEGLPVAELVRQPYLQRGTPTEMTVVWRTDLAADGVVRYGLNLGNLDHEVEDPTQNADHAIIIANLRPDTRYYYEVGTSTQVLAGGDADHYFVSAPLAGEPKAFTAWVVGDSGTGDAIQALVRDAMLAETAPAPPDIFVHVGDMAYITGTDTEFTNRFFAPYQAILRHTPFWPTLGNHEGYSSSSSTQTGPYYEAYHLPTAGEAGGLASGTQAYYSFDYANAHFVSLNSYDVDRTPGSPMLTWLAADLAATAQPWLIAFWHHAPYTKGSHDSDNLGDSNGRMRDMRENVLPILEAAGIDLVLTGHSHIYERSFLIDGAYDTPTTAPGHIVDAGDGGPQGDGAYTKSDQLIGNEGAVYVVAGHGGVATGGAGGHPVMFYDDTTNGSCLLTIERNVLFLRNLRRTGVISDDFTIVKGSHTGNCDADGDIDLFDTGVFADCLNGPHDASMTPLCQCADLDADGDVDIGDFAFVQIDFGN